MTAHIFGDGAAFVVQRQGDGRNETSRQGEQVAPGPASRADAGVVPENHNETR